MIVLMPRASAFGDKPHVIPSPPSQLKHILADEKRDWHVQIYAPPPFPSPALRLVAHLNLPLVVVAVVELC